MTAPRTPHYVPGELRGGVRVILVRELPMGRFARFPDFLGELDGTPIKYHCLSVVSVIAIRRGLDQWGTVLHDAPGSWLEFPTEADLRASAVEAGPELLQLRDSVLAGRAGGAADGKAAPRARRPT